MSIYGATTAVISYTIDSTAIGCEFPESQFSFRDPKDTNELLVPVGDTVLNSFPTFDRAFFAMTTFTALRVMNTEMLRKNSMIRTQHVENVKGEQKIIWVSVDTVFC